MAVSSKDIEILWMRFAKWYTDSMKITDFDEKLIEISGNI